MKKLCICGVLAFVLFTACKKGDSGPAGATGANGAQGPAGPKGDTGTANVIWSAWQYANTFRDSTIDNSAMHVATLPAASLTADRFANAAILVYFTYGGGTFPLPHLTNAGGKSSIINYIPQIGKILITRYTLDNSNSVSLSTVLQYRFVIIPGGVSVPNSYDYDVISQYFHAPPLQPAPEEGE